MKSGKNLGLLNLFLVSVMLLSACIGEDGEAANGGPGDSSGQSASIEAEAQPAAKPTVSEEPTSGPTPEPTGTLHPETSSASLPEATTAPDSQTKGSQDIVNYNVGLACLGTWGLGVTCLNGSGEWQSFRQNSSPLGGDFIADIDACDDGTMLILHGSGVSAFDGRDWREFPGNWGFESPDAVACTGADEFWVAHFQGASYFDGANWNYIHSANMSFGEEATYLVKDVLADESGNVWFVTVNSVALYNGFGWVIYQLGQGFSEKYFFDAIALDEDGRPWVAHNEGLFAYEDGGWELFQNRNLFSLEDVAVDQEDTKWVGTNSQGLALFDGSAWQFRDRTTGELDSNNVNAIKVDDNGQVWVATEYGLHIFDGQTWHIYRMENADLADNSIQTLAITGNPSLPQPQEKEKGSISGSVAANDEPYAYKIIEVCVEPLANFYEGLTPCSSQPFVRTQVTDGAGAFSFTDLAPGYYLLSIETKDGWEQLTSEISIADERVQVVSGQDSDVGLLTLSSEEE